MQEKMANTIEQMALAELGLLDDDVNEDVIIDGFNLPFAIVLETFEGYRRHGTLPHPGGLLNQSPLWREDMRKMTVAFNYFMITHKDDKPDGES